MFIFCLDTLWAAAIDQLIEHSTTDPEVEGSNPATALFQRPMLKTFYGRNLQMFLLS